MPTYNKVVNQACRKAITQRTEFMKTHGSIGIALEDCADERGINEFNLVLGDGRVNALRKSFGVRSVQDGQIKIVSMNEEHTTLICHENRCWKERLSVDVTYKKAGSAIANINSKQYSLR
jgi:outer membrane protein OmpA-like peptidoglycan-associated protein